MFQYVGYSIQTTHLGTIKNIITKWNDICFSMEGRIIGELQRIVQEEVSKSMQEQQTMISDSVISAITRSAAVTPAPTTPDPQRQQTEVLALLRQGQINTAFQQVSINISMVNNIKSTVQNTTTHSNTSDVTQSHDAIPGITNVTNV